MKYKWQLPLFIVFLVSGVLIAVMVRTLAASDQSPTRQRNENLVTMIETQEKIIANLEKNIEKNRTCIDEYQEELASGEEELQDLQEKLHIMKVWSGLTEAKGPGIILTVNDNRKGAEAAHTVDPNQLKAEEFLIHDKHLLYIVNELRSAGAEAISINEQRVINSSNIRCVGPMILVNTVRLAPPYTIKAIGNSAVLMKALEQPESEFNILKMSGYPVSIEKQDNLVISVYKGSYRFSFTQIKEE